MLLSELLEERGWTTAEAAALLNESGVTINARDGERPIRASDISRRAGKPLIPKWARGFGVEIPTAGTGGDGDPQHSSPSPGGRRSEASPVRPLGAPIVVEAGAKDRIAGVYRMLGGFLGTGVAQSRGNRVGNGVAAVWDDSADKIADCWIKAAETNPWAARFVQAMNAGGPMGDLAAVHVYLIGGTAYVLGAGLPDAVFAKYSKYRPVDEPAQRAERNGSGDGATVAGGAEGAVADGRT